jgi:LytS/YehU family sensor histidine kinase
MKVSRSLIIRNNLQLKEQETESTGTGLMNIENRYQLTFGVPIEVTQTDSEFIVKLPLIAIAQYENTHHRR